MTRFLGTATDAVLDAPASAGQFNVVSGQLVQLIDTAGTKLYGHVQERPDSATMKLKLTWQTTPDTYGTFGFSGSSLLGRLGLQLSAMGLSRMHELLC